jgi:hypothetical protein
MGCSPKMARTPVLTGTAIEAYNLAHRYAVDGQFDAATRVVPTMSLQHRHKRATRRTHLRRCMAEGCELCMQNSWRSFPAVALHAKHASHHLYVADRFRSTRRWQKLLAGRSGHTVPGQGLPSSELDMVRSGLDLPVRAKGLP